MAEKSETTLGVAPASLLSPFSKATNTKSEVKPAATTSTPVAPCSTVTSTNTTLKVLPVLSKEELYRYIDLGLGRGIDGTDAAPWLNKSSFQVREVTYSNLLGTEEGGAVQSYEREISSVQMQQSKIKSSIMVPKTPLTIGTDAELSRSVNTSRRAIGRQVINRTISFKDDFDVISCSNDAKISEVAQSAPCDYSARHWSFEERLANWILEKVKYSWEHTKGESLSVSSSFKRSLPPLVLPSQDTKCPLDDLCYIIKQNRPNDLELIVTYCEEFVHHFRITHYVNAIALGAAEYRVLTEDEYQLSVSLAGSFGIEKLGNMVTQQKFASKMKKKTSDLKKIGIISQSEKVERGSYSEAVVNVSIRSIVTLIKTDFLHKAMEAALVQFVECQSDRSNGPFYISCGVTSGPLYLQVDPDNQSVIGTNDITTASEFHIIPSNDTYNEFYIKFNKEKPKITHKQRYSLLHDMNHSSSIVLYLSAPVSITGKNEGPLFVSDTVADKTSRFVLHNRIKQDKSTLPVPLGSWTSGSEMYYINCSRRKRKRNGYLALKRDEGKGIFITACMSNMSYHDNRNVFMLFQLLPTYLREKSDEGLVEEKKEPTDETHEGDEKKNYEYESDDYKEESDTLII